ncbi:MAG: hypothetical protein FWB80_07775 [Defluviitaleaceae bacterium]|nr:hypothetical protein [Defluviitaleaceae bacterium]
METLNIDIKLKELIPPLLPEEYLQLEQNILTYGCRDAIVTWSGTIIDGHNRYEICTKHKMPFATERKYFASRRDAVLWILQNQLGRRNLPNAARIEIALQKAALMQNKKEPVRKTVARDAGVCEQTVQKYMNIKEIADPEVLARLQKGDEKIGTAHRAVKITEIRKICTPAEIRKINEGLQPIKARLVQENIAKIYKLYDGILRNFHLLAEKDVVDVRKFTVQHQVVLDGVFVMH